MKKQGIDFSDLPGFEFLASSDEDKESGPAWSIRLRYSDGHEQYVECPDSGLPDKVYLLYHELRGYFKSEEAGELDFVELAYGCSDLTELERLVISLHDTPELRAVKKKDLAKYPLARRC